MEILVKIYRYLRILSVDVVIGACISAIFIANYIGVSIQIAPLFTLAVCVWLIYTADHLMDAYHIKHKPHSLRHFYHKKYFKPLVYLFIIASSIGLVSLAFLPGKTVFWGAILLVVILAHFLVLKLIGIRPFFTQRVFSSYYICFRNIFGTVKYIQGGYQCGPMGFIRPIYGTGID